MDITDDMLKMKVDPTLVALFASDIRRQREGLEIEQERAQIQIESGKARVSLGKSLAALIEERRLRGRSQG